MSPILDDSDLLELLINDQEISPAIYRPGPYWAKKCRRASRELIRYGVAGFRGTDSNVGSSFSDSVLLNLRTAYRSGGLDSLKLLITRLPLVREILDAQIKLGEEFFREGTVFKNGYLSCSKRVQELLGRYPITEMDTTRGGCISSSVFGDRHVSHHYLQLLDTLDILMNLIQRKTLADTAILEIGGGFGVNSHLMIECFGARKILYLDISPNIYVGTQYLKSFYGESVIDYRISKRTPIRFRDDESLEIIMILPHQIEEIESSVDLFHNAHSFVEMPEEVVRNYAMWVGQLMRPNSGIAHLVTYDGYDATTTLDPSFLLTVFEASCKETTWRTLTPGRQNRHFVFSWND